MPGTGRLSCRPLTIKAYPVKNKSKKQRINCIYKKEFSDKAVNIISKKYLDLRFTLYKKERQIDEIVYIGTLRV